MFRSIIQGATFSNIRILENFNLYTEGFLSKHNLYYDLICMIHCFPVYIHWHIFCERMS